MAVEAGGDHRVEVNAEFDRILRVIVRKFHFRFMVKLLENMYSSAEPDHMSGSELLLSVIFRNIWTLVKAVQTEKCMS